MTGPEEVITPLLAPQLDLRGNFFLGGISPGVMATFLEGRSSFSSGFLFVTLATVLGANEDTPPFPSPSSPPHFFGPRQPSPFA